MLRYRCIGRGAALAATLLTLLSSGLSFAQAPAFNSVQANRSRILNEVHFQFVPDTYVNMGQLRPAGTLLARLTLSSPGGSPNAPTTVQIGDFFSDRRLIGAWSGAYPPDSFGTFRFTFQPTGAAPMDRPAGILLTPPADTNSIGVLARDLNDYGASIPHTRLTVYANGASQGAITMSGGWQTYPVALSLQDKFSFQLTGNGSATVTALYLYNFNLGTPLINSTEGLSVTATGGGATVSYSQAYAGPATDCALRVTASGVDANSRLVITNAFGGVVKSFALVNGANVLKTEEPDVLERNGNARVAYPVGSSPDPSATKVLWADDMRYVPADWLGSPAPGTLTCDGDHLMLQGPYNSSTSVYDYRIVLPTTIDFTRFPYLTMRLRASAGTRYYLRPLINNIPATEMDTVTALEGRAGKGFSGDSGWETCTFNVRALQQIYNTPKGMNAMTIHLVGDFENPPAAGSSMQLQIDWMTVNAGIRPDVVLPEEDVFDNSIDDDGDGLVDRDDPNYRNVNPPMVLANYQTLNYALARGGTGWRGNRNPGAGSSGDPIAINPDQFSPNNPTKRLIRSTFYPLDYIKNPNYEPPSNYNELFDQNAQGAWSTCASAALPPTEQFHTLDYNTLGGVEEYDPEGQTWTTAQASLARKYGLDGFVYNDKGMLDTIGDASARIAMAQAVNLKNSSEWSANPFAIAAFYGPNLRHTATDVANDLSFIARRRPGQFKNFLQLKGKPAVFCYPSEDDNQQFTISEADWGTVFSLVRQPYSRDFDGALNSSGVATPGVNNTLSFTFDRWENTPTGGPTSGLITEMIVYDKDMRPLTTLEFPSSQARSLLLDGWGADVTSNPSYTRIQQGATGGTPGFARMNLALPADAAFLYMRLFGYGTTLGGVQQNCEVRLNTAQSVAGSKFAMQYGWFSYMLRLANLPTGYTAPAYTNTVLPELPASFWGDRLNLVANQSEGYHRASKFDGGAHYSSFGFDTRIEVSHPQLHTTTVRPGFDQSGYSYYCGTQNPYFAARQGGAEYRREWEDLLRKGTDIAIITSWNEWGEGTNIEPDIEHGFLPVRLTLTYSLIFKGIVETTQMPSATNFLMRQFDIDGGQRSIEFTLNGPETVTIRKTKFGPGGSAITAVTRDGQPIALNAGEVVAGTGTEYPPLTVNVPSGAHTYRITYGFPIGFTVAQDDTFTTNSVQPAGAATGWSTLGMNTPGMAVSFYDQANTAMSTLVYPDATHYRVSGFVSNKSEWLPYSTLGTGNIARIKYYVYASGQANPTALNTIPNFRIRAANRFAVNSMLEVLHHQNADVINDPLAQELRPSSDPANPSVYRVDLDPVDVPYLVQNSANEGIMRGFEAYSLDPQDNGYLSMSESVMGSYPATTIAPGSVAASKVYQPTASDAGGLKVLSALTDLSNSVLIPTTNPGEFMQIDLLAPANQQPTYSEGAGGVTLSTVAVATNRVGIVGREFFPGSDQTQRVRVEQGKQYSVRFHVTSTQQSNRNAQIRLRARAVKFAWNQKLEIGGAWATGSAANSSIAQQALPGIGCQNPDKNGTENGGWYTVLMNTPLSNDIRPEFGISAGISARMPNIAGQPGPGANQASRRDLRVAADLIDTLSAGANKDLEQGQVTIDKIEVRTFTSVAD